MKVRLAALFVIAVLATLTVIVAQGQSAPQQPLTLPVVHGQYDAWSEEQNPFEDAFEPGFQLRCKFGEGGLQDPACLGYPEVDCDGPWCAAYGYIWEINTTAVHQQSDGYLSPGASVQISLPTVFDSERNGRIAVKAFSASPDLIVTIDRGNDFPYALVSVPPVDTGDRGNFRYRYHFCGTDTTGLQHYHSGWRRPDPRLGLQRHPEGAPLIEGSSRPGADPPGTNLSSEGWGYVGDSGVTIANPTGRTIKNITASFQISETGDAVWNTCSLP